LRNEKYGKQLGAVMRKWLTNWAKGGYRYGKNRCGKNIKCNLL